MGVPITEVSVLAAPTHGHVATASVAVTPWLHPGDEDEKREQREEKGKSEKQEAEGGGHGLYPHRSFKTHYY